MIVEDSSMEFDLFEDARQRLTEFLIVEGRDSLEAERIASYVVQGVRGVPKLLSMLHQSDAYSADRTRAALEAVLTNAPALDKARRMLRNNDDADA